MRRLPHRLRLALGFACLTAALVLVAGCGTSESTSTSAQPALPRAPLPPTTTITPEVVAAPTVTPDVSGSPDDFTYADDEDPEVRQEAWDSQEGDDWDSYNEAYATGWDEGCDEAFDNSPDGTLYDQGEEFTSADCQANNPGDASSSDIPPDVPDDPATDGEEAGRYDGCVSAFEDLGVDSALFYGEDEYDSSMC